MELITGISHDLRTPLTSMIGYIDLLKTASFRSKEEYNRFVTNTYHKAIHLKTMLDDLFEQTRLTAGEHPLNLKNIDLCKMLEQMLFEFEPIAQEHGLTIVKELKHKQAFTLIDNEKIARAFDNLFMNALKYAIKPGMIHIRLRTTPSDICVEIENKGAALSAEEERRLFDRFYKVDHARSNEGGHTGAGLGLSIARSIVELHGGTLKLLHRDGSFTFQLTLPVELTLKQANETVL